MKKGILIKPDGSNPTLVEWNKEEIFGNREITGFSILGAEYEGLKLLAFICVGGQDEPYNELASRIISHIKHTYYVKDIDICGSCIILDDEEDMNQEKYSIIKKTI